jgi:hypothetical protein
MNRVLATCSPEPLGRLILAALNDASIAHPVEPAAVQDEISDALITLFEGLLR